MSAHYFTWLPQPFLAHNVPCEQFFRLAISEYDAHTERGYVEFRANDGDGGEMIISCILTFSLEVQIE